MAVVNFGIAPTEFWSLTIAERDALITEFNRVNKKKNRR